MCGLTLLPRKVLPTIFLVGMSMNAISLESRLTIMTTLVGSGTNMPGPLCGAGIAMFGMLGIFGMFGIAPCAAKDAEALIRPAVPTRMEAIAAMLKDRIFNSFEFVRTSRPSEDRE